MGAKARRRRLNDRGAHGASDSEPAFYVRGRGAGRDLLAVLHPPYTAWHLSFVVIGAAAAPVVSWRLLGLTVAAFFLAVGVAAHALDELHGRPLGTELGVVTLKMLAVGTLAVAVGIGVAEAIMVGLWLLVLVAVGAFLVVGYNLEMFGGRLHTDWAFAVSWGGFPALVGYVVQSRSVTPSALAIAGGATGISIAQRALSTQARLLRRRVTAVTGFLVLDGKRRDLDRLFLLRPVEVALSALSWSITILALGLVGARLGHY